MTVLKSRWDKAPLLQLCLLLACATQTYQGYWISPQELLSKVLSALEDVTAFYEVYSKKMNLDGMLGSRIAEAQFKGFLDRLDVRKIEKKYMRLQLERMRAIQRRLEKTTDENLSNVNTSDPSYFQVTGFLTNKGIWEVSQLHHNLEQIPFLQSGESEEEKLSETLSDTCFAELSNRCNISKLCWKTMTAPDYSHYSLTHEILYLQVAERTGCYEVISNLATRTHRKTVDEIKSDFCEKVFAEAIQFDREFFPEDGKDLFMEQIAICGIEGFRNFFPTKWILKVLEWQKQEGCYGFDDNASLTSRSKRDQRQLTANCESHASAVAVAALAEIAIYLMDSMISFYNNINM